MMACLDDRGRLYVAESDGRNLTTRQAIERELPRFVRRLVDVDGDGVFDKSTIFADRMTMPEGGCGMTGRFTSSRLPTCGGWRIWMMTESPTSGRRFSEAWSSMDGRINTGRTLARMGGFILPAAILATTSLALMEAAPDTVGRPGFFRAGRTAVMSEWKGREGSIRLTLFLPRMETCSLPALYLTASEEAARRPDSLDVGRAHAAGLRQSAGAGDRAAPAGGQSLGQVAPAGLVRYRGRSFGAAYRDTLFACQFNTHKVVHVRLESKDGTFATVENDFLSSESIGFHPADILEDADGSLLLLDTGGWLSWGCPFSKNAKPEIKGAIYRIQKKGGSVPGDPRGLKIDWHALVPEELVGLLRDSRPAVRDRAVNTLIGRGEVVMHEVESAFLHSGEAAFRKRCLWLASRLRGGRALGLLREALADADPGVRQVAADRLGD